MKGRNAWFIISITTLFFLLRLPSLFEPLWYGDEGIYQVLGTAINSGRLLYRDIWDNKPPLLYLTYALFASDQFLVRLASLLFGIGAVIMFFLIAKKLFTGLFDGQKTAYKTTTLFGLLFGLPLLEGNIANSENFMLLPLITAGFLVLINSKKTYSFQLFIAGILVSVAFLFKAVAVFDMAAFSLFLFFVWTSDLKDAITSLIKLVPFVIGFVAPIFFVFFYFFLHHALSDFIQAAFTQTASYVGYGNRFLVPQGFLIFKLLLLSIFSYILFLKRKILPTSSLFVLLWTGFSVFNAFFSQRPYTHYLLVLLPSFVLLTAIFKKELLPEKSFRSTTFVLTITLSLFLLISFNYYTKTIFYYQNFFSFETGKKNLTNYQSFFDQSTPNDYQLAQFINLHTNPKDNVFIWGNNAQVYTLAKKLPIGRFTVAYHITTSKNTLLETKKAIEKSRPKYIIIVSAQNPYPYSLSSYRYALNLNQSIIYERIL